MARLQQKNESGYLAMGIVMAVSTVSLLSVGYGMLSTTSTRRTMAKQFYKDRPIAVIDAIMSRAIRDLAAEMNDPYTGQTPNGTLNHLLRPTSTRFTETMPMIYGKGEFQLPVYGAAGTKVVHNGLDFGFPGNVVRAGFSGGNSFTLKAMGMLAPETDPKVWISRSRSTCAYKVNIQTKLCAAVVTGRTLFASGEHPGLGEDWNVPCPEAYVSDITQTFFLNSSASAFSGTTTNTCQDIEDEDDNTIPSGLEQWRPLVIHSQQNTEPPCPMGWNKLWSGFSYLGNSLNSAGFMHRQDLGSTGSCLRQFFPLVELECTANACHYTSGSDQSYWLIAQAAAGNRWKHGAVGDTNQNKIDNWVSRCTVCEGSSPVIVRHTQMGEVPACPVGWRQLWQGVSFLYASARSRNDSGADLGNTGSCLQLFVPDPVMQCDYDNCRHTTELDAYSGWAVSMQTTGSRSQLNNEHNFETNARRVGRCVACSRY